MKFYKSYMIIGLFALGLTACNTDDLERDLDALKDRVENFEAQVQKLNDDMNIIRVMLDGNKTISEWSYDGSKYTIKLSNGETLTLTQGVVGENYPSVTIGENGNWFIAGEDSGIKASAEKGPDAPYTPIFKIESGQWCVSYDNGTTWTNLGGSAVGSADTNPSPIKDVNTDDPNFMVFTLSNDQVYKIPVVKSLICEITEAEVAADGLMYLGYGQKKTFKLKVNLEVGDILRPVVPADWKAEILTDYKNITGIQTLKVEVTAPDCASKCVVTMEVNRGANTITDEIVARTETKSYYDDYMAGLDIEIGGVKINRRDYPVEEINGGNIDKKGVYFLNDNQSVTITATSLEYLVLLSEDGGMGKCTISSTVSLENGLGLLAKNIDFTSNNIYFKITNQIENIVFDNCNVSIAQGKNVIQSDVNESIKNIFAITNSNFKFNNTSAFGASRVLNSDSKTLSCRIVVDNNIFYSASKEWAVNGTVVFCKEADITSQIDVTNNTFINFVTASQALIRGTFKGSVNFNNLLFWVYKRNAWINYKTMSLLFVTNAEPVGTGINSDKILFYVYFADDLSAQELNLTLFSGKKPEDLTAISFPAEETDPFIGEGYLFDFASGKFRPSTNYAEYGAQRTYE